MHDSSTWTGRKPYKYWKLISFHSAWFSIYIGEGMHQFCKLNIFIGFIPLLPRFEGQYRNRFRFEINKFPIGRGD